MSKAKATPIALTIAGSDSGGGAGIQADLKTFAALGVHGTSAITCVTAQNPRRVLAVKPCSPKMVAQQIEAVLEELPPFAVKTGMLYSEKIIRVVVNQFKKISPPLIIDPVMVSTSGRQLLDPAAIKFLTGKLLPIATLVTPNAGEAEILTGHRARSVEDLRGCARLIHGRFGCAVLAKGGHLKGVADAVDIFFDGKDELMLSAPFVKGIRTHGTGCTYSAAITALLARGFRLQSAVAQAKGFITAGIAGSKTAGGHSILDYNPQ